MGRLLCADGSNKYTTEQIGDEDDADDNIRELVLRKQVYTVFYEASILSITRQSAILKALADKRGKNKFMSHSVYYADSMNGSRKSGRPLKVEHCVILNAFVSLVDQDRIDEIKDLADSMEIQKWKIK